MSKRWLLFRARCEQFFMEADHLEAKTKQSIKIIRPEKFVDFLEYIVSAQKCPPSYRLIVGLSASMGTRISELLSLTKEDFIIKPDSAKARINIKKKRFKGKAVPKMRWGAIHPCLVPLLKEKLRQIHSRDKLFNISPSAVLKQLKIMFGITCHSLRHSAISYLITIKKWSPEQIKNQFHFENINTVLRYYNTSTEEDCEKIYA